MDSVGNAELRQGAAAASCGHRTRREPSALSENSRGLSLLVKSVLTDTGFTLHLVLEDYGESLYGKSCNAK
jgi:hypothetical protein